MIIIVRFNEVARSYCKARDHDEDCWSSSHDSSNLIHITSHAAGHHIGTKILSPLLILKPTRLWPHLSDGRSQESGANLQRLTSSPITKRLRVG